VLILHLTASPRRGYSIWRVTPFFDLPHIDHAPAAAELRATGIV
jgi:hypothetical protein